MRAGNHAVQIGQVMGDVYFTHKVNAPSEEDLRETIRLHMSLQAYERKSVVKWMQKQFGTGLIKDLDRANLGLALRYIRVVHKRVNSKAV
jgi:hypothetical protein